MLGLEKEQAMLSIQRLMNAIERETVALDELTVDWAAWDDTYQFVLDGNTDYIDSNLVDSTFTGSRLDLIVIVDTIGKPVYHQAYDRERGKNLPVPGSFFSVLKEKPEVWTFTEPGQFRRGFLNLSERVLHLSSRPIVTSNNQGPVRGTLVMGRFFSENEHARIEELTEQQFSLQPDSSLKDASAVLREPNPRVQLVDGNQLLSTGTIPDLLNQPLWQINTLSPRSFYQRGLHSLTDFMRWNFLITGLLALALGLFGDKLFRARAKLADSRERYRELSLELQTILDGITSPILLISKDLMIVWANQAGAKLYNQSDGGAFGKRTINLPFESFNNDNQCPVKRALANGEPEDDVAFLPDGTIMAMSAFSLPDSKGTVTGVICLMTDITEQVRLREDAEQRNRLASLGELAAELAHDINNPIGMLMINLPMVEEVCQGMMNAIETQTEGDISSTYGGLSLSFLKDKMPYLLEEMINNTDKIQKLSEDMKTFSLQQKEGQAESFNLNNVVDSAVRLTNYRLHKVTKNLHIQLADEIPDTLGCPQQIEQVVINLLLNACQALTSTDQAITVKTGCDSQSRQITIEVIDEGKGIAEQDLPQVTRAFFTTRRDSRGTGLGLSLSARIVKDHGGQMKIFSTLGAGTRVRVVLPSAEER